MKKSCNLFAVVLMAIGLWACGDDELKPGKPSGNVNANSAAIAYAQRLEIPRLRGGENDAFLVHTVPTYGVNYAVEWDKEKRAQRWSAYMWCNDNSVSRWNRNNWKSGSSFTWQGQTWPNQWKSEPFMEDPDLPAGTCATLSMHAGNGFDRGHIVASADRLMSMEANGQTYFLSNMHPQMASFNQSGGLWYNMEDRLRKWNESRSNGAAWRDTMWVVKGGLIDHVGTCSSMTWSGKTVTGYKADGDCFLLADHGNLVVPNYFFVAVLVKRHGDKTQGGYSAMGFFFRHIDGQGSDLQNYAYSVEELEKRTGIDFFCNLPDDIEEQVERNYVPGVWGLAANKNKTIPY